MAFQRYISMSPQYSYHHLSDILKLYPDDEPYCAGYAPSQKRRCHAPTNARNRSHARRLLDQGTSMLQAGQCIDDLLYDLAPLVLCTRWHQGQAFNMANLWISEVRGSIAGQITTRQSTPMYNPWQSTQVYAPWQPQPQPQPQPQRQPQQQPAYVDTDVSDRIAELTRKVQAAEKDAERARQQEERAKREAERIRQNTESLVRRSVAMGFARGQEEAGRITSGMHATAAVTGQVDRTDGLMAAPRENSRGQGVETTTPTSIATNNQQIPSDVTTTSARTEQRAASAASVPDANNNSSEPATPPSTEPPAVNPPSVSSTPNTDRPSSTPVTPPSAEQLTVSAESVTSTVDTNPTSLPTTPSATEQRAVNSSPSTSSTSSTSTISTTTNTSNSTNTEVSTPNPTTPSTPQESPSTTNERATTIPQETPSRPVPALIIQSQPTLTPPPSFAPLPTLSPTTPQHRATRKPIDGDCCICIFPLRETPNSNSNSNPNDLLWCQNQCGTNIHRSCMDEWAVSSLKQNLPPTCPMCRTTW